MANSAQRRGKPPIVVGATDHRQLSALAAAMAKRAPEVAEELGNEMDRAKIMEDAKLPADVVRMGSRVTYRAEAGERRVELVYPVDADIAAGRISIMTPIGAALIGLAPGQSITWKARDGREHELTIVGVELPAPVETGSERA